MSTFVRYFLYFMIGVQILTVLEAVGSLWSKSTGFYGRIIFSLVTFFRAAAGVAVGLYFLSALNNESLSTFAIMMILPVYFIVDLMIKWTSEKYILKLPVRPLRKLIAE